MRQTDIALLAVSVSLIAYWVVRWSDDQGASRDVSVPVMTTSNAPLQDLPDLHSRTSIPSLQRKEKITSKMPTQQVATLPPDPIRYQTLLRELYALNASNISLTPPQTIVLSANPSPATTQPERQAALPDATDPAHDTTARLAENVQKTTRDVEERVDGNSEDARQNKMTKNTTLASAERLSLGSYTVTKGDTLSALSREFDTSIAMLRQLNDLPGDQINIGEQILYPVNR